MSRDFLCRLVHSSASCRWCQGGSGCSKAGLTTKSGLSFQPGVIPATLAVWPLTVSLALPLRAHLFMRRPGLCAIDHSAANAQEPSLPQLKCLHLLEGQLYLTPWAQQGSSLWSVRQYLPCLCLRCLYTSFPYFEPFQRRPDWIRDIYCYVHGSGTGCLHGVSGLTVCPAPPAWCSEQSRQAV